jgi:nitrite reductase/ring-hydroxylating ferredoxin subunit
MPDMNETTWINVGPAADWPADGGKLVTLGARRIGVYRHQGAWYALKDICPHAGVSLARGPVTDGAVMCVGHGWRFSLKDGGIVSGPKGFKVPTYPARERDGQVEVDLG